MKRTLLLRVFVTYLAIVAFMAVAVSLFATRALRGRFLEDQRAHLENLAAVLSGPALGLLESGATGGLPADLKSAAAAASIRITVISSDGTVIADSEKNAVDMENHLYRPEIFSALHGTRQSSLRFSSTLKTEMLYLSQPLARDGRTIGVLRLSRFARNLDSLFARLRGRILALMGVVFAMALLLALFFSRSLARPLREVIDASARVAGGDFEARVSVRQHGEFRNLAASFNVMAAELGRQFAVTTEQKEELASILASIREGLFVVDMDGRILMANEAFRSFAGEEALEGRLYFEVFRSSSLYDVLKRAHDARDSASGEVVVRDRTLLCRVAFLRGLEKRVVTLQDLTEIRELERIKKDFVTNVSHELKTPLTAIKGFVETLEGRVPEEGRASLRAIARNADRMIAIVEDLLALSSLEEKGSRLEKEPIDLGAAAAGVVGIFEKAAAAKGLALALDADPALPPVPADPYQVERLLVNLVDNAVKYTERGRVTVRLRRSGERLVLEVSDTGPGIPEEHLSHIFERFYVVDKSRSRKTGGTGLGLSIVKHIALAHGGTIDVESRVGEGTAFKVTLPLK